MNVWNVIVNYMIALKHMCAHMNVPIVIHVQLVESLFVRTVAEIYKNVPSGRKNKQPNISAYPGLSLLAKFSAFKWGCRSIIHTFLLTLFHRPQSSLL